MKPKRPNKTPRRLPKKLENPLEKALREKLTELTDPRLGPLTDRRLRDISATAMLAQQLLAVGGPMCLGLGKYSAYAAMSTNPMYSSNIDEEDPGEDSGWQGTLAPSSSSETFASNMMREIVAAISSVTKKPEPQPDASSLVFAISLAQSKGMDKLAKSLEDRLLALAAAPSVTSLGPVTLPALPRPKKTSKTLNGKAKNP